MKVTILDTVTGKTHPGYPHGPVSAFDWAENNFSCDCNRWPGGANFEETNACESKRFLIIAAEPETEDDRSREYTLRDLNSGYPEELLRKHGL